MSYDSIGFTGQYLKKGGTAISGLQIGNSFNLTSNATFIPAKKDKRLCDESERAFNLHVFHAKQIPVALYDAAEQRGSLIDGASLALLLSRTFLSHPEGPMASEGRSTELTDKFKHLDPSKEGRKSAYEILTDAENGKLELYEDWTLRHLVLSYCHLVEKIKDHKTELSDRPQLDIPNLHASLFGFCFMDVMIMGRTLKPQSIPLHKSGWLKFTEEAGAINITGRSFGQIFKPLYSRCRYQDEVPSGQNLLVTQVRTLRMVARKNGGTNCEDFIKPVEGYCWNNIGASFKQQQCHCHDDTRARRCGVFCTVFDKKSKWCMPGNKRGSSNASRVADKAAVVIGKKSGVSEWSWQDVQFGTHIQTSPPGPSSSSGSDVAVCLESSTEMDSAIDMGTTSSASST